jgi:hypothetical protein
MRTEQKERTKAEYMGREGLSSWRMTNCGKDLLVRRNCINDDSSHLEKRTLIMIKLPPIALFPDVPPKG